MKKINLTNYKNINLELEKYNHNFKKNCKLIAVSKKQSINSILELHSLGHCDFGENYLQEGIEKIEKINSTEIIWHFIGPIQSNKSTQIATHFDWIHSVDRIKVYNKIKNHVEKINKSCNFLIQINISDEQSKNGMRYDQVDDLLLKIDKSSENMIFRGIMAIPSNTNDESKLCDEFSQMQETFQSLSKQFNTVDTLSMGMSNDYQLALKYGATMIRIGTKIFGARI